MTDHQVLVFGSFTEDEIRSMQCQPQKNDIEIIFGSFDLETLRSVGIFPSGSGTISVSEAAVVEENGCASTSICPDDSGLKELKPVNIDGHASVSSNSARNLSKNSTTELPGIHGVSELSSSENVVLDDSGNGVQKVVSKGSTYKDSNWPTPIHRNFLPRGLVNLGNLCFLNATLQALLSCSPFLELLHELRNRDIPEIGYPTLRAFVDFISDFDMLTDSVEKRNDNTALQTGIPFRPTMFDSILNTFTPDIPDNLSGRPRQEDAQEFLSFVMHQMHDELLKLDGQVPNGNGKTASLVSSTDDEGEDDNWETVGPRNKTAITRTQSFLPSKLSSIFGGQLRSVVKARGNKASATIQPFLLLHLNICPEPICTVEDALRFFSAPETLDGYRISAAGKAEVVTASKSVQILELSEIMVLHLMRFSYGSQGSTKLHKTVHFPLELLVGRELLASPTSEARRYELVATITHHGRDPSKGHYTADALHPNGTWLRYDDASVTAIPKSKVLHDQAYVLFYKQL
ncbi:ubiquitin-specific protease 24 [Perilla frutescens var. hirtella]|uniref:Ubiquitin carboxyl-terminal hydrolase n=1 Tax=Perilla frutescens var. hirtella TaxID=608512 RepID=A0AAD4JI08_PERFH|nr:ubiquitin-specific protease 24 [Perilla frutescens var. hirtella]KAH6834230.1 ubiquitin-specific protease 24 [Perilla frutescens var. hirtella]